MSSSMKLGSEPRPGALRTTIPPGVSSKSVHVVTRSGSLLPHVARWTRSPARDARHS
jgi:hypothetical protein